MTRASPNPRRNRCPCKLRSRNRRHCGRCSNWWAAIIAIPERTAVISPQLGGWVSKLDVVEGQSVRAGDVLVELDARSAQVAVQRAEALVAEKDAAVRRLKSGYLPTEIAGAASGCGQGGGHRRRLEERTCRAEKPAGPQ